MGKPSIFSREYENRMKKRKRNIIVALLVIIAIIGLVSVKFIYNPIDFNNIKQNIQAWIDSDTAGSSNVKKEEADVHKEETIAETSDNEDVEEEPEKKSIDISVNGKTLKGIYTEENSVCTFVELEGADDSISYDISPSKNKMIVMGSDSEITEYDTEGKSKVITKDKYVSTKGGSTFEKNSVLQSSPNYLWNNTPKFLSDTKIIFTSNRPYFGTAAVKQYLWITDTETGNDNVLWDLAAANVTINGIEDGKMKVTIDGKINYLDGNGNRIQ